MQHSPYPCIWCDRNAHEMADYYCSIFPDSKIISKNPIVVIFEINGAKFMALSGGPEYKPSNAVSFVVNCDTQAEIDRYWDALGSGGVYSKCGWLNDRYGVAWQIVPSILGELMNDPERAPAVMYAFMQMGKFDIEALKQAGGYNTSV